MPCRPPRRSLIPALVMAAALSGGCTAAAHAAWWWPFGYDGLTYDIRFTGITEDTRNWLEDLKLDQPNESRPPQTEDDLRAEAAALGARLRQALEALGYYEATYQTDVDMPEGEDPHLTYAITPGPRYTLGAITVEWPGAELPYTRPAFPFQSGDFVNAQAILTQVKPLEDAIAENNCLLSLSVTPQLTLHQSSHTAGLAYVVTHGPAATFGPTVISGTERVAPVVITRATKWKQGACYRNQPVEDTRAALLQTRLFSTLRIRHARQPEANGEVPMRVTVTERAPRTLSAGASYGTDDTGLAVTAGWEHRNILGAGQTFTTNATVSQNRQELANTLTLPYVWPKVLNDTRLVLTANLRQEDTDTATTTALETGASLQKPLTLHLTGGAGVGFNISRNEDALAGSSNYALLSFPTFLTFDNRDDVLNSRRGVYANLTATPYTETIGDGGQFVKTQLTAQTYLSANMPLSPTLALRGSVGSITGSASKNVPSDIRFFAGGGNSVRGYGFETLGPRKGGKPVGGTSLFTASAEVRTWFTPTWGGVAFADAGNVYAERTPQVGVKLYYGTGVGVRYATPIGPLRFDVAVPMNGDDIGAAGYAVYLSIGQSF